MNRRLRQFISGFLLVCVLALAAPFSGMESWASSGKISFSDPSAMVGNQVTVNVKVTATEGALGGADIMLAYDPSVLEFVSGTNANGGAGSIRLIGTMDSDNTTSFSYTLTFKTLQAGNTGITVANYEVYDKDLQAMTMSHVGSSSVKVTPLATYSSEAALSSLQISPGELTPAFSPDVTSYTASVAGDVDKIAVSAAPKDKMCIRDSVHSACGAPERRPHLHERCGRKQRQRRTWCERRSGRVRRPRCGKYRRSQHGESGWKYARQRWHGKRADPGRPGAHAGSR